MAIQAFSDFLFDGSLDFPCTYERRDGTSFQTKAILAFDGFNGGQEAGKGLSRSIKQVDGEFKHFRMPASDFDAPPAVHDSIVDDTGAAFRIVSFQPSRAGTYMIYTVAKERYRGPDSGLTRR